MPPKGYTGQRLGSATGLPQEVSFSAAISIQDEMTGDAKMGSAALKLVELEDAKECIADLDDTELARRALTNDRAVWAEFVRRFEPVIRTALGRTLAAGKKFLCSDSVDDALSEY